MGCGQGTGQVTGNSRAGIENTGHNGLWTRDWTSDRTQQSRNREDRTQWAVDKITGQVTGNSRAGIVRTGHNGLWTRERTSDRKQQSRNREDRTQWAVDKGQDK